jgi:AraC-like DNA-binding protein
MKRNRLIGAIKRTFLSHRHHAYTRKQLSKKFNCSEILMQNILRELVGQSYVLKIRHGQQVLYTLHPSVRK